MAKPNIMKNINTEYGNVNESVSVCVKADSKGKKKTIYQVIKTLLEIKKNKYYKINNTS